MRIVNIIAAAVIPAAIAIGSATAGEEVSVRIDRDRLDTEDGIAAVYRQFVSESRFVCSDRSNGHVPLSYVSGCTDDLVASLVEDLDDPRMTAFHRQHAH